jgi:hypothetical protein
VNSASGRIEHVFSHSGFVASRASVDIHGIGNAPRLFSGEVEALGMPVLDRRCIVRQSAYMAKNARFDERPASPPCSGLLPMAGERR